MIEVTAPYNLVPAAQQKRAVERLSNNPPPLALLEGDNIIHDGGGLALRNPYLYRYVVDNYVPRFEDGFIIGHKKDQGVTDDWTEIEAVIKNISDKNWDRGFNRTEAGIVFSDPVLLSFINVGDQVRLGGKEVRTIKGVSREGSAVRVDGPLIGPEEMLDSNIVRVIVKPQMANAYRDSLFQRSFPVFDLQKIPVSWGRSEKSLNKKMSLVKGLDNISPILHHLAPAGGAYSINGADPYLTLDLAGFNTSGHDAGLLRLEFSCQGKSSAPRIQIFWWGDDREGPAEVSSVKFTADEGVLIVPLDASPLWLTLKKVKGLRIDLDNGNACHAISLKNMALFQRKF